MGYSLLQDETTKEGTGGRHQGGDNRERASGADEDEDKSEETETQT